MAAKFYDLCACGDLAGVEKLLSRGVIGRTLRQSRGPLGDSPLHAACKGGHDVLTRLLIGKLPAHVELKNAHGKTALHTCCEAGQVACGALLIKAVSSATLLNHADVQGCTALMRAAIDGHSALVDLLAQRGDCALDVLDDAGMPALYRACVGGHVPCVTALLRHGAALQPADVKAKLLRNVLARAERDGHDECVAALRSAMARHAAALAGQPVCILPSPLIAPALLGLLVWQHGTARTFDEASGEYEVTLDDQRITRGALKVLARLLTPALPVNPSPSPPQAALSQAMEPRPLRRCLLRCPR